jgi:hypothetical protein
MPRARSKKSKNSLRDASTKIEAARRTPSETPIRLGIEKSFESLRERVDFHSGMTAIAEHRHFCLCGERGF